MVRSAKPSSQPGRRPSTTRGELSDLGIELFAAKGFEETSVDDIADAAGIARRTFFRYFPSKNAVPWGDFDAQLTALRTHLNDLPGSVGLADGLHSALLQFNTFPKEEAAVHRQRMALILGNPALQSYSMVMYEGWRQVIAEYVAARTNSDPGDHLPRTVGWMLLGVAISAYEHWLIDENNSLPELLTAGASVLFTGVGPLRASSGTVESRLDGEHIE
ncbi:MULTISPECIES: mycofactocin system transcriptional regulator [unclassified Rhodococcus (in: high G+C Gram-positive bacteria)]|uniref:mycofactocin system transcriptional regulator n=1 Tax=unclassified Rhodococcus (in: high G+C Gram-positive bacteria) TaxID=192944 RepID=UPI0007BB7C4B|nr:MULTISPECIES: mycofactocin system transcriptional regulator [unclassified Rhodococcus (in: high G+C Gram-positive bacteria)]KZF00990.1 mycofactocin system transcriptional regulator [Rhodococcus sp. EPR-279]KZF02194.1 mycofactocin system transcriptional regulator [Rhodococcus sp. EPR-147]